MAYQEALEAAGATVHAFEEFGSYQGDWWAYLTYRGRTGFVVGSYGSCSGCDAFDGEFGHGECDPERLAKFGAKYLDEILTPREAYVYASRNIGWDNDARAMVNWILAQAKDPALTQEYEALKVLDEGEDWREALLLVGTPEVVPGDSCSNEPFGRNNIAEIIALTEGMNGGPDWLAVFRLLDGRFAFLSAGCDYTGWDCRASGSSTVASNLDNLVRFGLTDEARERLHLPLPAR